MRTRNLLTLAALLLCTATAFAQRTLYFIDYAEVPPEVGYRSGYVVTLKGDTIYGKLRNTESVGSILTPRVIRTEYLEVQLKNGGALPKIAFIPELAPKSEQQKYKPEDIKAFGYLSSYMEQQPVELESAYNKSGFIKGSALRSAFSLRDPYEDIHLLQRNIYDHWATFESRYVDGFKQPRFLQRLAEGRITLYYDTEHDNYYIAKSNNTTGLVKINYSDPNFLSDVFGNSKQVAAVLQAAPEMKRQENFLRLTGIYNLEADGVLELALTDFIITAKGDTLKGNLQMKGLSNLMVGTLYHVKFTGVDGKRTDMKGDDIKRIVKYINNMPIVFDAFVSPADGKRYFYQLQVNGKMKLYYNARSIDYYTQTAGSDVRQGVGSYLLVNNEEAPIIISKKNFDEHATRLFTASSKIKDLAAQHPEKQQYDHLPQLVSLYNSGI